MSSLSDAPCAASFVPHVSTAFFKIPTQVNDSARKIRVMLTAAKEGVFSASSDLCVLFPLAASRVYPKTRVRGSKPENVHCSSAIGPLKIELCWGCEESSEKTAVGSGVSFKYDPFGRRIYKSSSASTSIYAYDGDNLIEETSSSGAVVARYSEGLNIDEPLAMLRSGGTSYYQTDGLNSITSLSSTAGALAQTYTFDSFGRTTNSTGSLTNPFQYTAREFDTETGLYFYRARYFDPSAGRFLSEDPLRFAGGSPSFYPYAYNSPVDFVDPLGLQGQGTATAPAPTTTAPPVELPIAGGAAAGAGTAAAAGAGAEGAAPIFPLIAGGSAEGGSVGGPLGVAIGALAGLAVYDGIQLNNYINALRLSRDPAPQPKTPGKGCRFIKEVHMGGECKSCVYLCPGYGGLVTFGQAAEKPCPGILPNGLVDTSQLDPKCSGQKKNCPNKK